VPKATAVEIMVLFAIELAIVDLREFNAPFLL
jgi:hypothetical protein